MVLVAKVPDIVGDQKTVAVYWLERLVADDTGVAPATGGVTPMMTGELIIGVTVKV